jgi:hypothetical protein
MVKIYDENTRHHSKCRNISTREQKQFAFPYDRHKSMLVIKNNIFIQGASVREDLLAGSRAGASKPDNRGEQQSLLHSGDRGGQWPLPVARKLQHAQTSYPHKVYLPTGVAVSL